MIVGILRKFWPNLYFNRVIEENFKSQGAMASIPPDGHWAVKAYAWPAENVRDNLGKFCIIEEERFFKSLLCVGW